MKREMNIFIYIILTCLFLDLDMCNSWVTMLAHLFFCVGEPVALEHSGSLAVLLHGDLYPYLVQPIPDLFEEIKGIHNELHTQRLASAAWLLSTLSDPACVFQQLSSIVN